MMDSYNDIENNDKRLAIIEESITKTLLYDNNNKKQINCLGLETSIFIYISLGVGIIILIVLIIMIFLQKI